MSKHAAPRSDEPSPVTSEGHFEHDVPGEVRRSPRHRHTGDPDPGDPDAGDPGAGSPDPGDPGAGHPAPGTGDRANPAAGAGRSLEQEFPGASAGEPQQIPRRGWVQVLKRAWAEAKVDQVPLLAAGVAFYSFLALFPAMIAAVTVYGLVADRATVARQAEELSAALPAAAAEIVVGQMRAITEQPQQSLGLGLVIALVLALWSASGGVGNIVTAVNIAYDEEETRGFVKRKVLSLGLTLGAVLFAALAVGLIAVAPPLLDALVPASGLRWLLEGARWTGLLVAVSVALAVLYRYAPDRDSPRFAWVSVGAVVATVIWLVASLGFSLYVDNFGSYAKTYGALAGVAVLMLWLWITAYVVLLGAEVNAESEQQTVQDSTVGPPAPRGRRGAVKADNLPYEQDTVQKDA